MFVRTGYFTGDPARVDRALDGLSAEAVGLLSAEPGYVGYGLFADRELGIITMGSWWATRQNERDSAERLRGRRDELLAPFAGTATVDVWEAAEVAQAPAVAPGSWFRLVRFDLAGADRERIAARFREDGLPAQRRIDGCLGGSMLLSAEDERGAVGILFADRASLVASRGPAAEIRARGVTAGGLALRSLEEFETVLLDVRES
ncbi:hypothetical protein ABTX81_15715 [Kitasatospora sp. NPDC097605]|uniref:hypothetical protein n=1 Tax=Kitasatospora sp. NPDC097605 TaxID=3157226 RepID=UPI00331CD7D1